MPNEVLEKIYATRQVEDAEHNIYKLHSGISSKHADALYKLVRDRKPAIALEVGMAYGLSAVSILQALKDNGQGRLISIDPNQCTDWHGVGLANVERAGLNDLHTLIEEPDYTALPSLLKQGEKIDLAYIDGWHTFDYVLVDFFYVDKLLNEQGVVGFNDCGLPAIDRAISFMKTHRRYSEMDAGIKPDYKGRNALVTAARWILRKARSDRYFEKDEDWEPAWGFYSRF